MRPGPNRDIRIPNRHAFKIVLVGGLHIEQVEGAIAIEDHFSIARSLDHDRLFGSAAGRQIIRALKGCSGVDRAISGVELGRLFVGSGMHQDHIAWFHARAAGGNRISASAVIVVSAHERVTGRRNFFTFVVWW